MYKNKEEGLHKTLTHKLYNTLTNVYSTCNECKMFKAQR